MSSAALGYTIDVGFASLSDIFAKTGGKLPRGDTPKVFNWFHDYFTPVIAVVDRLIL